MFGRDAEKPRSQRTKASLTSWRISAAANAYRGHSENATSGSGNAASVTTRRGRRLCIKLRATRAERELGVGSALPLAGQKDERRDSQQINNLQTHWPERRAGAAFLAPDANTISGAGSAATRSTAFGRQRFGRYRELVKKQVHGARNASGEMCLERFTKHGQSGSEDASLSTQEEQRTTQSGGASFMTSFQEVLAACKPLTLSALHATRHWANENVRLRWSSYSASAS